MSQTRLQTVFLFCFGLKWIALGLRIMETIGEEAISSKFQDLKADCFEFLCLYFEKQNGMIRFVSVCFICC